MDANRAGFEEVRPALRKAGRALGVGLGGSKKSRKMKVLRMRSSIVENVPTPQESLLELFPASQLPYRAKIQKLLETLKFRIFPYFLYRPGLELFAISEI